MSDDSSYELYQTRFMCSMKQNVSRFRAVLALIVAACLMSFFSGCSKEEIAAAPRAPGALDVGVQKIEPQSIPVYQELPGRTEPYRVAEVRARVDGIVLKRFFEEGTDVKTGELLFQIDPAPYEVVLQQAKASLARAEASLQSATLQEKRYAELVKTNAVSEQNYENAVAALQIAEADVAAAKAAINAAEINLGYTKVTAPIDGRIGLSAVTEGAYVRAGAATLLATVQQMDPIYVNLVQSSSELLKLKRALRKGNMKSEVLGDNTDGGPAVQLLFEDGSIYEQSGVFKFADVTVDKTTGAVTTRVVFPNPDMDLLPGIFVHARFEEAVLLDSALVPQHCLSRNYRGDAVVWVVVDGKAQKRIVKAERTQEHDWIVTEGLAIGDQVIANNLQRLREGVPVNPIPWSPKDSTTEE